MRILLKIVKAVDWVSVARGRTISVGIPLLVIIMLYEIISRFFFGVSTHWSYDISIFIYGYTGLLAGAWVMKERKHINVDIVLGALNPRGKAVANSISALLVIFFLVVLIMSGSKLALAAFKMSQKSPSLWGAPIAHFKAVIPAAAFMVLLQTLANLIRDIYMSVTGRPLEATETEEAQAAGSSPAP